MTIAERIKTIRKNASYTQSDFAKIIGVKEATVTSWEAGYRNPAESVITSICREFDVREEWLRTGEGEMYIERTRRQVIADFLADVLKDDDSFRQKIIEALAQLDQRDWEHLETIAKKLTKKEE